MRERHLGTGRSISRPLRRTQCAVALAVALALSGCASRPDYTYARESRNDRPYRGGAAAVPDERPKDPSVGEPSAFDLFAFLGVFALAFTHGVDYIGSVSAPPPPPIPDR